MLDIYIDADACPVKAETYRVANRYELAVFVVANMSIRVPPTESIQAILVKDGPDAADDWIANHAGEGDIVVTADIPLAARCLKNGVEVLGSTGRPFTEDAIGSALAMRDLHAHLREMGEIAGGPAPLAKSDRSRFLQALDQTIHAIRKRYGL